MGNDKKNVQEVAKKSFLGQVGGFITNGASIVFEEIKYFLNPMNWGHSGRRVWHEVKQVANQVLRKPIKEYFSRVKTEPYSEYSISIAEQGGGYVVIKASDIFTGKIQEMSDAHIKEVNALNDENTIFDIVIDRVAKKIIIEIDVKKIVSDIEANVDKITDEIKANNKGKDEEEIKMLVEEEIERLAIGKIIEAVDSATKGFAEINGGELKTHTDSTLLTGIGKTLYQPYKKQKDESKSPAENPTRPSEAVLPSQTIPNGASHDVVKDSDSSLTNPNDMLHQKSGKTQGNYEHILSKDPEIVSNLIMLNAIKIDTNQAKTGAGMSNLLPKPGVNNNKTGPGIS